MPNRLARETSPYLLQHAHNPVDWFPWGEEALTLAKEDQRPILLSVGYSACHWCHVMERESFEDEATAAMMNRLFINIKVDREERPDVDSVYMRAVQALTGQGGWPLTVFLTPDGEPYYGGTYFPPQPRHGLPSFQQVLQATHEAFTSRREAVDQATEQLLGALRRGEEEQTDDPAPAALEVTLNDAARFMASRFDPTHGGFGRAPKFPQPVTLEFLLRWWHWKTHRNEEPGRALHQVVHTLRSMARGGLRDHLGGGFHRYSVDERWLVPHFEKMLYDNALLARLYTQAWQVTGDAELRDVAESTLDWILRDLRAAGGAFFSAFDADSEGEEGLFYVWRPTEVEAVLGKERAKRFSRFYDVSELGNFEGRNILHIPHDPEAMARAEGLPLDALSEWLGAARADLLAARGNRVAPERDDKILSSWNGFTIRAMAEAGGAFERSDLVEAAARAMQFVLDEMRADGRLLRTWTAGEAKIPAFLEDYASVGNALLTVYEVTLEEPWLREAEWAVQSMIDHFFDPDSGRFFDTADDAEALIVRPRELMDNATPSGVSLAIELLQRAGRLLSNETWARMAAEGLDREAGLVSRYPTAFGRRLSVMVGSAEAPEDFVIVGSQTSTGFRELHMRVLRSYRPGRAIIVPRPSGSEVPEHPLLEGKEPVEGGPTVYVCRDFTCLPPVNDVNELGSILGDPE